MQSAVLPHAWKATQYRGFSEKVVLENQTNGVDGRTWTAQIRADVESPTVLTEFTIEVVTDDPDEVGNIVLYFSLTADQTALLGGISKFDVKQSYADAREPDPLFSGTIETAKAVTRPAPVP